MEDDNSLISGASVLPGLFLSFDESKDGAEAEGCPGLKLGFRVMRGRLFLV